MSPSQSYSSYPLYSHPLLKASASLRDGKVKVDLKGPLARIPRVKSAARLMEGQIPCLAGEKLCFSTWVPPAPSPAFDRFVQSQVKALAGIRTPDQVTISITEECPNRCIHCALPDSGHNYRLEPDVAKDVIRQVLGLGATLVTFDGGEPSLYRELPELVSSVGEGAISNMFTSGAGFTPDLARSLKEAGLYAVNVSIDSPVPEEHDAMRGRFGAFRDAMKAIGNALAAGLLVDIYVVIRKGNMKHLSAFHKLARRSGAHELTFFEVVPTGRYAGKTGIILSDVDYAELGNFLSMAGSPRIFSVPAALSNFGCFAGRTWLHITPDGQVYPCACLPKSFGSIFEEPLSRIWRRMGRLPYRGRRKCPVREGQVSFNSQD